MGCELGKLVAGSRAEADGRKDAIEAPPPTAAPDPRLPLTAKQKYSMIASWKGISRAMESTGVYMFIKLFEEHQELLGMFERFKELRTQEQQAGSMELAEHATTVMSTLDEGIKQLDDLDAFLAFVTQVGATHRKIPGFHSSYFWKIEKPFLDAVQRTLGDRYTDNIDNIYRVTIKFIIETLVQGYEEKAGSS
ncbi:neuroglobin-like [Bacillus rossius redtenbacheri]|uniref:neuroglobin-like n=1 Tax=Bacillus rossius redtenbacheri TaxID=93214 RepID=UPI002FDD697D